MSEPDQNPAGLFKSVRQLLDTGLAAVQNRLELFVVELKEEKCHVIQILIWASAVILLGLMAIATATFTIVFLVEESARVFVLAGFCLFYILAAVGAFLGLKKRLKDHALPFGESIAQIKKDRECL